MGLERLPVISTSAELTKKLSCVIKEFLPEEKGVHVLLWSLQMPVSYFLSSYSRE